MKRTKITAGYLDVGAGRSLPRSGVIGIFDMDTATVSKVTRKFLTEAERRCQTVNISYALPKAFVVYEDGVGESVTFSPFTVRALAGRG